MNAELVRAWACPWCRTRHEAEAMALGCCQAAAKFNAWRCGACRALHIAEDKAQSCCAEEASDD